jgi:hypothetical protein
MTGMTQPGIQVAAVAPILALPGFATVCIRMGPTITRTSLPLGNRAIGAWVRCLVITCPAPSNTGEIEIVLQVTQTFFATYPAPPTVLRFLQLADPVIVIDSNIGAGSKPFAVG